MEDHRINEFMDILLELKNQHIKRDITMMQELSQKQKLTLYILYRLEKKGKISLCELRKNMKLAPSTITQIVASLENEGVIVRKIDKEDRRNIFLQLTKKGHEYAKMAHDKMQERMKEYIDYMGEEKINILMNLMRETLQFFEERKK